MKWLICSTTALLLSLISASSGALTERKVVRFYEETKYNGSKQVGRSRKDKKPGCHNFRGNEDVYRMTQFGYAYCQVFTEKNCASGSVVPAWWTGGKYRRADIDENKGQERILAGDQWFLRSPTFRPDLLKFDDSFNANEFMINNTLESETDIQIQTQAIKSEGMTVVPDEFITEYSGAEAEALAGVDPSVGNTARTLTPELTAAVEAKNKELQEREEKAREQALEEAAEIARIEAKEERKAEKLAQAKAKKEFDAIPLRNLKVRSWQCFEG